MPDIVQSLQAGTMSLWLFIPLAILLGAMHGLEPGHSKTMMAAFIIAIRGTIAQAILLGLAAAISHSLIICVLAMLALYFGSQWNAENIEPYLQIGSAVCILVLAAWMFFRTRREVAQADAHGHDHAHSHDDGDHSHHHHGHESHSHTAGVKFHEGTPPHREGEDGVYQDAHERAHATDIAQRFAGRTVTTPQIIVFGITGGLMPCPAAFSVLLVCLQLKRIALGLTLVASFSFGLALTMVATGAVAAWSVRHAQRKFAGFGEAMRRAPYVSCVALVIIASYMAWHGWHALHPE